MALVVAHAGHVRAIRDGAIFFGPQRLELSWYDGTGFVRMARFLAWNDPVLLLLGLLGIGRVRRTALGPRIEVYELDAADSPVH